MFSGNTTQFGNRNYTDNSRQVCDVIIGFDFGTSCSKVVLQTPHHANGRTILVSFGNFGHPTNRYFLLTRLFFDTLGDCSLTAEAHPFCATGLKIKLLHEPNTSETLSDFKITPRTLTTAYLALAFRDVRQWFLRTQKEIYGQYELRWHVNLGIPSPGYNDHPLRELFRSIALDGWRFSLTTDGVISLKKIWCFLGGDISSAPLLDIHPDQIQVIPEIVAEITGYAKSHLRENGLHVLIDVGASTVDISGFILHERDGEDRYSFLISDLEYLGAYNYHTERVKHIKEYMNRWFAHLEGRQDLVMPIEASLSDYFPTLKDFGENAEKEIINEFYQKCKALIHRTLRILKKKRDPSSDKWKTGLPVFLCGGGKSLPLYQQVLRELNEFWKVHMATNGFEIRNIPKPQSLTAEPFVNDDFDRFAVAYGLSFPYYNIGEITPPDDIKDIEIERIPTSNRFEYISKDMV